MDRAGRATPTKRLQVAVVRLRRALAGNGHRACSGPGHRFRWLSARSEGRTSSTSTCPLARDRRPAGARRERALSCRYGPVRGGRVWRGSALAEVAFEAFAQREIRRLDELRLTVVEARVDAICVLVGRPRSIGELRHRAPLARGASRPVDACALARRSQADALQGVPSRNVLARHRALARAR